MPRRASCAGRCGRSRGWWTCAPAPRWATPSCRWSSTASSSPAWASTSRRWPRPCAARCRARWPPASSRATGRSTSGCAPWRWAGPRWATCPP
jgi:hypothetical protein